MHRLSVSVKYVVSDVNDIVYRTNADKTKLVLQPFGTFFNGNVLDSHTSITRTRFGVFYHYIDIHIMVVYLKLACFRTMQRCLITVLYQPCIQVASYTVVRASVGTVRSDVHFEHIVALNVIIILGQCAWNYILRKYDDTVMAGAYTDFVFCTNHSVRLYATQFRLLDCKALVAIIKFSAKSSNYHLLSGCHISGSTNNLHGFAFA